VSAQLTANKKEEQGLEIGNNRWRLSWSSNCVIKRFHYLLFCLHFRTRFRCITHDCVLPKKPVTSKRSLLRIFLSLSFGSVRCPLALEWVKVTSYKSRSVSGQKCTRDIIHIHWNPHIPQSKTSMKISFHKKFVVQVFTISYLSIYGNYVSLLSQNCIASAFKLDAKSQNGKSSNLCLIVCKFIIH